MLTQRYRQMYENGEISLQLAEEYSAEILELLDEDAQQKAKWRSKKVSDFEIEMKRCKVSQNDILRVIHCYRTGRVMTKRTKNVLEKVTNLFNSFFRSCKNGSCFSWKEYFDIYEIEL